MSKKMNTISLRLNVYDKAWFVLKKLGMPSVEDSYELGTFINNKEDAIKCKENGYELLELNWCSFQSMIENMRGGF